MSSRPRSGEFFAKLGHERQVPGGQRTDADDVDVVFDRLPGRFGRRSEQRADVDVESKIGERAGNHFLSAVVAVLSHLGDQIRGRRPSACSKRSTSCRTSFVTVSFSSADA